LDPTNLYSASGVYHSSLVCKEVIWNKLGPTKVSLFAWRLFNNRLQRCGVLNADTLLCTGGFGKNETANHLFFNVPLLVLYGKTCFVGWEYLWCSLLGWLFLTQLSFSSSYLFGRNVGHIFNLVRIVGPFEKSVTIIEFSRTR
jgi:hypothetical protein